MSSTHALTKYVLCKQCLLDKNFALARVSRGNGTAAHRTTTNARKHIHTHHKDLSERLLKMDGRVRVGEDAGMDMFVQPAPSHHKVLLVKIPSTLWMLWYRWSRRNLNLGIACSLPLSRNSRGASTLMHGCLRSKQSSNMRVLRYVPLPVYMCSEMVKCRMCVNTNVNNCV